MLSCVVVDGGTIVGGSLLVERREGQSGRVEEWSEEGEVSNKWCTVHVLKEVRWTQPIIFQAPINKVEIYATKKIEIHLLVTT